MKNPYALLLLLPYAAMAQSPPPPSQSTLSGAGTEFGSGCPYPEAARKAGVQGATGLEYTITEDLVIKDATVISSSGNKDLDNAAISYVENWRVTPQMKFLKPSRVRMTTIAWTISATGEALGQSVGRPHICTNYYPKEEYSLGIGGTTAVAFRIRTDGTTSEIKVAQPSGNAHLDEAAAACVHDWLYVPAMQDGHPIEVPWKANVVWQAPQPAPPPATPPARRAPPLAAHHT